MEDSDLTPDSAPAVKRRPRKTTVFRQPQRLAVILGIFLPLLTAMPGQAQEAATLEEIRDMLQRHIESLSKLLVQGYTIVAPEYRGSTGYGRGSYEAIDYGGLEIEDTYAARDYMLERHDFLDEDRVGIIGWSHGGLPALMNIFEHGEDYVVAFAGVPVNDLVARTRMGYKTQRYRDLYSAEYHRGIYRFLARHLQPDNPVR